MKDEFWTRSKRLEIATWPLIDTKSFNEQFFFQFLTMIPRTIEKT